MRDFCGTRSCFVLLSHAQLWISNGHPASVAVENQHLTIEKNPIFDRTSSFEPGGRWRGWTMDIRGRGEHTLSLQQDSARRARTGASRIDGTSFLEVLIVRPLHRCVPGQFWTNQELFRTIKENFSRSLLEDHFQPTLQFFDRRRAAQPLSEGRLHEISPCPLWARPRRSHHQ